MVKVQAQSHFAKKVELDGYRFDSQKEATKKLEPIIRTDVSYDWQDVVKTS